MEFNKKEFNQFREDAKKALAEVEAKYGVIINFGNIRYNEYDFDMSMNVVKNGDSNTDIEKLRFESDCKFYGFDKSDYNREFSMDGKRFRFIGFNTKARKNTCKIYCLDDNKTYVCSAYAIRQHLDK